MKKRVCQSTILTFLALIPALSHAQNFNLVNQKPEEKKEIKEKTAATTQTVATVSNESKAMEAAKIFAQANSSKYTMGATDVLDITVQRHPEVSGKFVINNEGKIQFQFVGDIAIAGLTKEDATPVIAKALEKYIIKPEITIQIVEYNSKVVYVVGEVGAPGKIFMRGDTITVRDALLSAGLPQLTAATDNATLFTPSSSGKVEQKKVNVYALLYKGDLRENYVMQPGDTIYLPATLWAKVARFINPITQPVSQAAGTGKMVAGGF